VVPTRDAEFAMMLGRQAGKTRRGPAAEGFDAMHVLPAIRRKAVEYIGQRAADESGRPFFLYMPLASPHTPILPTEPWRGKSGLNPYGDFVMETDAAVGAVLEALERHGLARDTLVIFTSDNGCSPMADFDELQAKGHHPSHVFRGHKADIFEGGHRVPFLVRWPARVPAGSTSDRLVCLTDLVATCAEIVGVALPETAGEDSVSFLPVLVGSGDRPTREAVVHHSVNGSFAIRQGRWKLCLCPDSGGWSDPRPGQAPAGAPPVQLFDLVEDIGERVNLAEERPDVVALLTGLLEEYVERGRSTPGARQPNTAPVTIRPPRM
jgi:arylsulfatase A-like enzyme